MNTTVGGTETVSPVPPGSRQLGPEAVERFWEGAGLTLSALQRALLPRVRSLCANLPGDPAARFLSGHEVEDTHRHLERLALHLLDRIRPRSQGESAVQLLAKLIDRGNQLGLFSLCPPPLPVRRSKLPSPFREQNWVGLDVPEKLRQALESSINRLDADNLPTDGRGLIRIGQLFASAIAHGGLINAAALGALARQMMDDAPVLDCLGGRIFVELKLAWRGQEESEFRRWFPDVLSGLLLLDIDPPTARQAAGLEDGQTLDNAKAFVRKALRAMIRHARAPAMATNLSRLLEQMFADACLRIPMVLAHYAARNLISHSLKPDVWRRLHGAMPDADRQHRRDRARSAAAGAIREDLDQLEPRWVSPLMEALMDQDGGDVLGRLAALRQGAQPGFAPGEPGELFAGFAEWMMERAVAGKIARKGVSTSVRAIARRLGALLGSESVMDLGAEQWTALYQEVLTNEGGDAASRGQRRRIARILYDFHQYLRLEHEAEQVDTLSVLGVAHALVPVDANIVTEQEFLAIRQYLSSAYSEFMDVRMETMAWLLITLAYRCGLRRMEVLKLDEVDVLLAEPPELLVRPTERRRLKTGNATRKLPLYALLEPDELERLAAWLRQRREEEAEVPYSPFLFCHPQRGFIFVPQESIIGFIHDAMRSVTGDATLRFHHLRHSFACRSYLMLEASRMASPSSLLAGIPGMADLADRAVEFRRQLYGNTYPTRRDIWALGGLLGHSGPDVSLEHYIHFLDVALAEYLDHVDHQPSQKLLAIVAGTAPSQVSRHQHADGLHAWLAQLWGKACPERAAHNRAHGRGDAKAATQMTGEGGTAADLYLRLWRALKRLALRGEGVERVAELYGFDAADLALHLDSATVLSRLKMSPGGRRLRHRFMPMTPDMKGVVASPDGVSAVPIGLRETVDLAAFVDLAPRLSNALARHPEQSAQAIGYYVENGRPNESGVVFHGVTHRLLARSFMEWLRHLGFGPTQLRFEIFDRTATGDETARGWRDALGLEVGTPIGIRSPPNGDLGWACPWLAVTPLFEDGAGGRRASPAFRFAMVMVAIDQGITSATQEWSVLPPTQQ